MKRINMIRKCAKLLTVAMVAMVMAGCADGEMKFGGQDFDIMAPQPSIIFSADPSEIKAGQSTTLYWTVVNADTVEITAISSGASVDFHIKTDELSGSAGTPALSATTDFVLTATKKMVETEETESPPAEGEMSASSYVPINRKFKDEAAPEAPAADPTVTSVSQTVTVTVIPADGISANIAADHEEVMPGDSTIIRWEVTPADGVVVDVSADSQEPIAGTDQCDGDMQSILMAGEVGNYPAKGCAVVTPEGRTVYTVDAHMADDPATNDSDEVVVSVSGAKLEVVSFTVNKATNAVVTSYQDPVLLEWLVTPEGALVTIQADQPIENCDLPVDSPATARMQELSCMIMTDTTFTLTAKLGDKEAQAIATVSKVVTGAADVMITSDGWAFTGEEVKVRIEPKGSADMITRIAISDAAQETGQIEVPGFGGQSVIERTVKVPAAGVRVAWECPDCEIASRDTIAVQAVSTTPKVFRDGTQMMPITQIAPVPYSNAFLYGVKRDGYKEGTAFIYQAGTSFEDELMMSVDFGPLALEPDKLDVYLNPALLAKMDYPVGAIAMADDARIYAGISGALVYSEAGDRAKWKLLDPFFGYANSQHPYPGSHPTCAGETQKGNEASGSNTIATFHQFCDAMAFGAKGLMVATDRGVFTLDDVDAYIGDRKNNSWKGIRRSSSDEGDEFMIFARVANDLERADDDRIFAATSKGSGTVGGGVFVTADNANSWAEFGLADEDVYSLAYDLQAKKIYAGTATGVMVSDAASPSWEAVGSLSQAVYSLAIDPYSSDGGVLLAGTDEGLAVLRGIDNRGSVIHPDGSVNTTDWVMLDANGENGVGKVRALAIISKVNETPGTIRHLISVGTAKGVMSGDVSVDIDEIQPPPDDTGDEPPPKTDPDFPDDTGSQDGDGAVNE